MQVVKTLLVLVLLVFAVWGLRQQVVSDKVTESLPIRYVRTEGVFQYLSKDELKAALLPLNGFGQTPSILRCMSVRRMSVGGRTVC